MVHKDVSSRPIEKVLNEVLLLSYQCLQQPPLTGWGMEWPQRFNVGTSS